MIRAGFWGAIAVAAVAGLSGCGDGRHRAAAARRSTIDAAANAMIPVVSPGWLGPLAGGQPSVAVENQLPGTGAWRLPGAAAEVGGLRSGDVTGYVSQETVLPGMLERIYVDAAGSRLVQIRIFRIGWYQGRGGRELLDARSLRVPPQPACQHRGATGLTECDWHPTLSFRVPPWMPSGVYIAKLTARTGASDCLFVVRSLQPTPLLAQLPTATYQAYNGWGGDSLYPGGTSPVALTGTTQGIDVSLDRPDASVTGAGQFFARDVAMVRFLERYRYPVSYTTDESADADPAQLAGHRALIVFGHSEYWSARQANGFVTALRHGTSLLWFSSDTLGWRVRYGPASAVASQAGEPNHSIIAYKEFTARDPNRLAPTGVFPDRGASLTGSAYLGCITARLAQPGPPTYRYYAWSPAPGLQPRWLFAHTGVSAGTSIPGIVGYELDQRTPSTPPGTLLVGGGSAPCMSTGRAEPGEPQPGPGQNRADTTLLTLPSGAIVFDTGTLGWELGLEPVPSASPDAPRQPDPRLVAITRNVLAHVLR